MTNSFLARMSAPLHIAHRGGALVAPENTLFAFRQAVEKYATDMIETDVQRTKDGVVVVFHDDTLDRCTDMKGPINQVTWAELQQADAGYRFKLDGAYPERGRGHGVSRLADVLRAFPDLPFNIDVKPQDPVLVDAFVEVVKAEGAVDRVCIGSEHDVQGAALFERLPDALHFYPRDALTAFVMAALMGQPLPQDERYAVLDMPLSYQGTRLITPAFVAAARGAGKWVNVWTIDDEADMRQLVADGVGGIMTDRPDLLRAVLG